MSSKFLLGSKISVLCCVAMCCALLWAFGANSAQAQSRSGKIAFAGLDPKDFSSEIWVMNADGSNPTRLTYSEPFINNAAPTFNRDGSKIAFVSNRDGDDLELYVMNANGSGVQRLTNNDVDENDPAFSPDGSKIAFSASADFGNPQIFVLNAGQPEGAGNQRVQITDNDHFNINPAFSPDGNQIAYSSIIFDFSDPEAGPNEEIIVANADGTNPQTLAAHSASDSGPAWSPDGSQIAFSSNRGGEFSEIYVVNADGGTPVPVTNRPDTDDMEPAWSPDGTEITFVSLGSEESIFIVSASGGTAVNIPTPTINDRGPVWAPGRVPPTASVNDVSVTEGNTGSVTATFTVTLSSPYDQPVTVGYSTVDNRAVAPDDYTQTTGTLVFNPGQLSKTFSVPVLGDEKFESIETFFVNLQAISNVGLGDAQGVVTIRDDDALVVEDGMIVFHLLVSEVADIWLMRADGSEQFNLTNTPDVMEVEPVWSPDGTRILYTRYLDSETFSQAEIYVMNADGTNRINLTNTLDINETSASWSPDGSQIVYVSSTFDGNSEIAVMNADGTGQTRITHNDNPSTTSLNLDPVWSPNGNKIAFSGNREGNQSIIVMDTDGGNQQILTNKDLTTESPFSDRQPKWSPDSSKITFMREDATQSFQYDVMLVGANGNNLVNLTASSNVNDMYPSFSPDGTQVVFSSNADGGFDLDLYALAVPEDQPDQQPNATRGHVQRGITRVAGATQLTDNAGAEEQPDWLRRQLIGGIAMSINNVTVTEGNTGSLNAVFTVTLSAASTKTLSVNYATVNGTAIAGTDYTSKSGTLSFAPGTTSKTIVVPILGDTLDEADEIFRLTLSNTPDFTIADNQAVATILDNDVAPSVSINSVNIIEGNSGSKPATFTVTLSAQSARIVTVNAIPSDGTARTPSDYTTGGFKLTFAPGETSKTFSVPVIGDLLDEANEAFYVLLSSPANASIGIGRGVVTITDNDLAPSVSIEDLSIGEGNSGQRAAFFRLRLSAPSGQVVKVSYATANGTATAGNDYVAVAPTQVAFPAGSTVALARVLLNGDLLAEPNETFRVNLSSPVNATLTDRQAVGTILNDDTSPTLSINDVSISEGNSGTKLLTFTATLSKASGQTVTVNYATADGIARSSSDYVAKSGTLTFAPGSALTRTVSIVINGDTVVEGNETLYVLLSGAANASISKARGVGTLTDDDVS